MSAGIRSRLSLLLAATRTSSLEGTTEMVEVAALAYPTWGLFVPSLLLFPVLGGAPKPPEFCPFVPKTVCNQTDESGKITVL